MLRIVPTLLTFIYIMPKIFTTICYTHSHIHYSKDIPFIHSHILYTKDTPYYSYTHIHHAKDSSY